MSASDIQTQITELNSNTNLMNYLRGQTNLGKNELDPNAFLQLMMAQLQYQDPTNPTDSKDFLAQQAQMTQVQKLNDLVNSIQTNNSLANASSLVGKNVTVKDSKGVETTGVVSSASISNGTAAVTIGTQDYPVSQITKIFANS